MSKKEDIKATLRVAIVGLLESGFTPDEINALTDKILSRLDINTDDHAGERRPRFPGARMLKIREGVTYDPVEQCVHYADQTKSLSPTEAKLLHTFLANRGEVLSYREIVRSVQRKPETTDYDMTTRNWIHSLRTRLGEIPGSESWISNVRGVGYYFFVD